MTRGRTTSSRRAARGFTLLEVTIILAVIAILALLLAPSIVRFLTQSRLARAQNDVQQVADAVLEFNVDNGFFPQYADGQRTRRIRLLISPGAVAEAAVGAEPWTQTLTSQIDLISNHLVNNRPSFGSFGYPLMGPLSRSGWNGPYLAAHMQSDPWGNRYVVNVEFLSPNFGAFEADGLQEKRAVWVMSAGPDGVFDTLYPTATDQLRSTAAASPADVSARIQ